MRLMILVLLLAGCDGGGETFTLYRDSLLDDRMRIHVATFNANESGDYNQMNCHRAAVLFQAQPKVEAKFWCESGGYRK